MNTTQNYKVIGLMSGTSLDGLDIAYCHFQKKNHNWFFSIEVTTSISYDMELKEKLKHTIDLPPTQLLTFNNHYGNWLGIQVKKFIDQNKLTIDFIASHGHTVFHQPDIGITYQIGSGQHLANITQQKVICDFRTNDVALGGQGAPLVPIGDQLLFSTYDYCLNLGGISNISYQANTKRIAFDISPANMLLNHICKKINLEFDDGGQIAKTGTLNTQLFNQLNALPYYQKSAPKSLGIEWFINKHIPILEATTDTTENLLCTAVHHIAEQIAKIIKQTNKKNTTLLITGGGAKNKFLIDILRHQLPNTTIIIPENDIIDYKEALIFAFMGVLRDQNKINCLQSVTGAKRDSSSGVIYYPS